VWLQGQFMPPVELGVDGRPRATVAGQLSGNSLVPGAVPPISVRLSAGPHTLSLTRAGAGAGPGEEGAAVLDAIFLTPAGEDPQGPLRAAAPSRWRTLCGRRYQWAELVPDSSIGGRT
jgi:hypothetical protein